MEPYTQNRICLRFVHMWLHNIDEAYDERNSSPNVTEVKEKDILKPHPTVLADRDRSGSSCGPTCAKPDNGRASAGCVPPPCDPPPVCSVDRKRTS